MKQSSTEESFASLIQMEILEGTQPDGFNQKFIEQLAMQSDNSEYSSVQSQSPKRRNQNNHKPMTTTRQMNRIPTEISMGTIKDSTIQNSEMVPTEDFVFKENNDNVKGSPRASDQLLHQVSIVDQKDLSSHTQNENLKRLKNLSVMKMINNGLHLDQKQPDAQKDAQIVNMKNFQKYFKNMQASIKLQNKTSNSPYFKYVNPYKHTKEMLNLNTNPVVAPKSLDSSRF